jgi:hypothetical protein
MKYFIRPTLSGESLEPWVWVEDNSINGFIRIENLDNGKIIRTYKRTIDKNFVKVYNEKRTINFLKLNSNQLSLIINEYYRNKLGLEPNQHVNLVVKNEKWYYKIIRVHWGHPHPTVQYTNRVTIISFIVGIIGIALSILSSLNTTCP